MLQFGHQSAYNAKHVLDGRSVGLLEGQGGGGPTERQYALCIW